MPLGIGFITTLSRVLPASSPPRQAPPREIPPRAPGRAVPAAARIRHNWPLTGRENAVHQVVCRQPGGAEILALAALPAPLAAARRQRFDARAAGPDGPGLSISSARRGPLLLRAGPPYPAADALQAPGAPRVPGSVAIRR